MCNQDLESAFNSEWIWQWHLQLQTERLKHLTVRSWWHLWGGKIPREGYAYLSVQSTQDMLCTVFQGRPGWHQSMIPCNIPFSAAHVWPYRSLTWGSLTSLVVLLDQTNLLVNLQQVSIFHSTADSSTFFLLWVWSKQISTKSFTDIFVMDRLEWPPTVVCNA